MLAGLLRAKLVVLHAVDVHGAFREGIHYGEAVKALEREVACEEVSAADRPADVILGTAEQFGADYVLMGVQGRSRAGQILLGSVTQEVLLRADRPVLMVGGKRGPNDPMLDKPES